MPRAPRAPRAPGVTVGAFPSKETNVTTLSKAWGAIRASLEHVRFADIKAIVGLAGLDMSVLSRLEQKQGEGGATKGQLMTAIDGAFGKMSDQDSQHFVTIVTEELLKKDPSLREQLQEHLSRHGVADNRLVRLDLFEPYGPRRIAGRTAR